jgi:hypothetical protein
VTVPDDLVQEFGVSLGKQYLSVDESKLELASARSFASGEPIVCAWPYGPVEVSATSTGKPITVGV